MSFMLKKAKKQIIYIPISFLFICCILVIILNFFAKNNTNKKNIEGINPVTVVKSSMKYKEPLTVILEYIEKEETIKKEPENIETKVEESILPIEDNLPILEGKEKQTEQNNKMLEETTIETAKEENEVEKKEIVETQYQGFPTIGKIEIPKTGVNMPILDQVTVEGMKLASCLLYKTGELNQDGNNLIVGHNFRDHTLFSNNKNLKLGDKIYITTLDGNKVEYTIYDKFVTTPEDVSYIKRETNNKPEITLSCCTDDDEYRIIILAKIIE